MTQAQTHHGDENLATASRTLTASKQETPANGVRVEQAAAVILEHLASDPAAAASVLAGYTIVPLPMTPAERAARYLPGATEKRRVDNEQRLLKVKQVIAEQLTSNPLISDYNLAAELNAAGLYTYTKKPFTASGVRLLLNRLRRSELITS